MIIYELFGEWKIFGWYTAWKYKKMEQLDQRQIIVKYTDILI